MILMDLTLYFMKLIVHTLNFKLSQIVLRKEGTWKAHPLGCITS